MKFKIEYETEGQNWIIEDVRFKEETDDNDWLIITTKEVVYLSRKLNKLIESNKFKKIQKIKLFR